jgi:hypothetical protein
MRLCSSGFGDSDIDVFFYGLTPKAAKRKLRSLLQQLAANADTDQPPKDDSDDDWQYGYCCCEEESHCNEHVSRMHMQGIRCNLASSLMQAVNIQYASSS